MKWTLYSLICFLILFVNVSYSKTNIVLNEDPNISRLMDHYIKINKSISYVNGWRITIMTSTDRRQVEEAKAQYQRNFSERSKWDYKEPYYYLKAGAYLSRSEATWALDQVKKKFPGAFLSADKISYDEL